MLMQCISTRRPLLRRHSAGQREAIVARAGAAPRSAVSRAGAARVVSAAVAAVTLPRAAS